jgi:uncharacterized protein (DUF697 family)
VAYKEDDMPSAKTASTKSSVNTSVKEDAAASNTVHPTASETLGLEVDEVMAASPDASTEDVNRLLRYHVWTAMGVGLIPFPITDLLALTGVQLNLLRKLAQVYHVPFRKDLARSIIASLAGGVIPVAASPGIVASIAKTIPVLGQTVGVVTMPMIAGATTYALGKVFIQHFASGGTFLTFDPARVKAYYAEMLQEGHAVAADVKAEEKRV